MSRLPLFLLVAALGVASCGGEKEPSSEAPLLRTYGPGMSGKANSTADTVLRADGTLVTTCSRRSRSSDRSFGTTSGERTSKLSGDDLAAIRKAADGGTLQFREQFAFGGDTSSITTRDDRALKAQVPADGRDAIDAIREEAAKTCRMPA